MKDEAKELRKELLKYERKSLIVFFSETMELLDGGKEEMKEFKQRITFLHRIVKFAAKRKAEEVGNRKGENDV